MNAHWQWGLTEDSLDLLRSAVLAAPSQTGMFKLLVGEALGSSRGVSEHAAAESQGAHALAPDAQLQRFRLTQARQPHALTAMPSCWTPAMNPVLSRSRSRL
jgi:hypothetical protein